MAVMDAQALNTDPEGLAFLADVLGTGPVAPAESRRFPIEAWTPALRVSDRVLFGTTVPQADPSDLVPAHAE